MIHEYIKQFTDKKYDNIIKVRKKYYLVNPDLLAFSKTIDEEPFSIGIPMGEEKHKMFRASVALLEMVAKDSERTIQVDEKAEWLFLCGRDIFRKAIVGGHFIREGLILVQNTKNENLGLGKKVHDGQVSIKHIIDRGDFLRRER